MWSVPQFVRPWKKEFGNGGHPCPFSLRVPPGASRSSLFILLPVSYGPLPVWVDGGAGRPGQLVPELEKSRVGFHWEGLGSRPLLQTSGSGSLVLRVVVAMEEPEMQLKGKKGNAGPRAGWRVQELQRGGLTKGGEERAKTERECEGQRLNSYRILARPLTSLETFRKFPCLDFVICKIGRINTLLSFRHVCCENSVSWYL